MNANVEDNEQLMKAALGNLPIEPDKYEITFIPEHIKELEKKAKETSRTTHQEEHDKIVKQLGNEYQKLRKENAIKAIGADADDRDRWKQLKNMKKEWTKKNFNKKDKKGKHIQHDTLAESAANYLNKEHWGKKTKTGRTKSQTG